MMKENTMRSKLGYRVAVHLAICLLLSCAGKGAPQQAQTDSPEARGLNELSSVTVEDRGNQMAVVVNGSQSMSPNIFQLTDPHRIIIDLTNTSLGSVTDLVSVGAGGVDELSLDQFDDGISSLSRIVISLQEPLQYQVESQGTQMTLLIDKGVGAGPLEEGQVAEMAMEEPLEEEFMEEAVPTV